MIKSYQNFVLNCSLLPWEQVDNPTYKDQHVFEIAYIRFKFVYDYLIKLNKKKKLKFLDVGCYPGQLYFMLKYSFVELKNILSYCGFELIEHNYFDREQGQYYIEKSKVKKKFRIKSVRNFISYFLVKFFNLFPHLRNHHFLVFKKSDKKLKNFEDLKTTDLNSWVKFRDDINF